MPPKEANPDWWKKRIGFLKAIAEKVGDVDPQVVYEKPGLWPLMKLVTLDFALGFYLPIMNRQRQQGNWDELHYVDLMAGNGLTRVRGEQSGAHLVAGTAMVGANCHLKSEGKAFDHYHFVEPHKPWAATLERRLSKILPKRRLRSTRRRPPKRLRRLSQTWEAVLQPVKRTFSRSSILRAFQR